MCRFCEEQCWRDGGWGECAYTDAEFQRLVNEDGCSADDDDALFDADELGLDPEDDDGRYT